MDWIPRIVRWEGYLDADLGVLDEFVVLLVELVVLG